MPAIDSNKNASRAAVKRTTRKRYTLPSGPRGDSPATRTADFRAAARQKRTRSYTNAIKVAYKSQPVAARQKRVARIGAKLDRATTGPQTVQRRRGNRLSVEDRAILNTYLKRSARDRKQLSSPVYSDRARKIVEAYKSRPEYGQALSEARSIRLHPDTGKYMHDLYVTDPGRLKKLGFHKEGLADEALAAPIYSVASAFKAVPALAEAAWHDPVGVPTKTAKQIALAVPASIGGAYELATHPLKTSEALVKSIHERAAMSNKEMVKEIRKEGGLPELLDTATVLAPLGVPVKNLGRFAKLERAGHRMSGGRVARRQGFSLVGHGIDKVKAARLEHDLRRAEAGDTTMDPVRMAAARANRKAGHTVEVVPMRLKERQHELVARARGRAVYALRSEQHRRIQAAGKKINQLNSKEKRAFYYAATLGIRNGKQAREILPQLHKLISDTRTRDGVHVSGSFKKSDMVPEINAILADPESHFTKNLGDVVEGLRPDSIKAGREDPSLKDATTRMRRRYQPLAQVLGLERGKLPGGGTEWVYVPGEEDFLKAAERARGKAPEPAVEGHATEITDLGKTLPTGRKGKGDFMGDADLEATWGHVHGPENGTQLHVRERDGDRRVSVERYDADGKMVGRLVFDVGDDGVPRNLDVVVHSTKQRNGVASSLYDHARAEGFDVRNGTTAASSAEGAAFRQGYLNRGPGSAQLPALPRHAGEKVPGAALAEAVHRIRNGELDRPRQRAGKGYYEERPTGPAYFDERDTEYLKRLAQDTKDRGLASPLYFRSERYHGPYDFASRAIGGRRRMALDQRSKGRNLELGLMNTSPDEYLHGLARNIKRKHNWRLVADLVDAHALRQYSSARGTTLASLRHQMAQDGVDMNRVGFMDAGVYRAHMLAASKPDPADMSDVADAERFAATHEFQQAQIAEALSKAIVHGQPTEEQLMKTSKWIAVPKEVLTELENEVQPSTKIGRSADILKGKASRAILLAGNVPWLSFQVLSEGAMATVGSGGRMLNPKNWIDTYKWWHNDLTPEDRDRVGAILGLSATGADSHQVKLGASSTSDMVNAYRALKAHPMWHTGIAAGRGPSISQLNPFELMAQADRGKANAFRLAMTYSRDKQTVVKRMGEGMGHMERTMHSVMSVLQKPPREQMRALANDPEMLERNAAALEDWLGDYTTLTHRERRYINRVTMFFPYLRYSLRLVFYTMPVKHPVATAILGEVAQLHADEMKQLFGEGELDWDIGKIYFGEGGHVKSIDLKRANPALNALWDAAGQRKQSQLIGLLPPYAGWLYNYFSGKDYFRDRDLRVEGKAADYGQHISPLDPVNARVFLNELMSTYYPVRVAEDMAYNPVKKGPLPFIQGGVDPRLEGTQGDDSLVFSPRPTKFRGVTNSAKLQRAAATHRTEFELKHRSMVHELEPLIPWPSRDVKNAKEQMVIDAINAPHKKKHNFKAYGVSGSSKRAFGTSSSKSKPFGAK